MPWLINAAQVDKFRKSQRNVVVLATHDQASFLESHVTGARFCDLSLFNDPNSAIPKLTYDIMQIADAVRQLGINNDSKIIFYDHGQYSQSYRALWLFKVFGHNPNQLYILNGGCSAWEKFDGKMESGEAKPTASKNYQVNLHTEYLRTLAQMKQNYREPTEQVVDLRHPICFAGGVNPNPDLRRGHIPGSFSFPFTTMFENNQLKPIEKIRHQLMGIGVDPAYPIITTSGSGTAAAILNFILDLLGYTQHTLYDGSWSEWGMNDLLPGEMTLDERPVVTSLE